MAVVMKYGVEMSSGVMMYIPSFIKIGSGIQKFMGGGDTQAHNNVNSSTYFHFFKIRKMG
jgi:hypothetical protein